MALVLPRAVSIFRKSTAIFRTISNSQIVRQNAPLCIWSSKILKSPKCSHLTSSSTIFHNSPSFILRIFSNSQINLKDPKKIPKLEEILKITEEKEKSDNSVLKQIKTICFSVIVVGGIIYWGNHALMCATGQNPDCKD